jgi:DNA replication protein DnaC
VSNDDRRIQGMALMDNLAFLDGGEGNVARVAGFIQTTRWKVNGIAWGGHREVFDGLTEAQAITLRDHMARFVKAANLRAEREAKRQLDLDRIAGEKAMEQQERARLKKRREQFVRDCPAIYLNMTAEASPRPRQFKFITEYWTHAAEDARAAAGKEDGAHFLLFGPSGTGKTASCWAAFKDYRLRYDEDVAFVPAVKLVRLAKRQFGSGNDKQAFDEVFEQCLESDVLFLDDIGTEKLTEASEAVLFEILDSRFNNGLQTYLTSNHGPRELAAKFPCNREKILRRLEQFCVPVDFSKP